MSINYGNTNISEIIYNGTNLDRVYFDSVLVFEKTATYKLTPYIKYGWSGSVTNDEWYDDDDAIETLKQGDAGNTTLGFGIDILKNGELYYAQNGELKSTGILTAGTYYGTSSTPSESIQDYVVHKFELVSAMKPAGVQHYFQSTETMESQKYLCDSTINHIGSYNNYWWLIFRTKNLSYNFKGNDIYVGTISLYKQLIESAFSYWTQTLSSDIIKKQGTSTTITT